MEPQLTITGLCTVCIWLVLLPGGTEAGKFYFVDCRSKKVSSFKSGLSLAQSVILVDE